MQKFNSKIDSEVSLDPIVLPHYALGIKIYDTIARRRVIKRKNNFTEDNNYKQFVDPGVFSSP